MVSGWRYDGWMGTDGGMVGGMEEWRDRDWMKGWKDG